MPLHNKVVWQDGMFIAPQHFQHNDAYHEGLLHFRLNALAAHGWGLTELEIDESALENGEFKLKRCAGVFPDGLAFSLPKPDGAPKSRDIKEDIFPVEVMTLEVHLALPSSNFGGNNCRLDSSEESRKHRFSKHALKRSDENVYDGAPGKEREFFVAGKNLTVIFSHKKSVQESEAIALDGYTHLKIAEIVRTPTKGFKLQEKYIPPCLHVSASPYLLNIATGLRDRMLTKSRTLAEKCREKLTGVIEFSTFDVTTFWLLRTVNSYVPLLSHFVNLANVHPETLYRALAQLAGELTTFKAGEDPGKVPPYLHADLTHTFDTLEAKIQELLQTVISDKCIEIPLELKPESWRLAAIEDKLLQEHEFYLAVSADMPEKQLIREVLDKIKIAILDDIERVVHHSLPTRLLLAHKPNPPAAVSLKAGLQYFRLPAEDAYWKKVRGAKNLAIYLPKGFNRLHLELMAVKTVAVKAETEEDAA